MYEIRAVTLAEVYGKERATPTSTRIAKPNGLNGFVGNGGEYTIAFGSLTPRAVSFKSEKRRSSVSQPSSAVEVQISAAITSPRICQLVFIDREFHYKVRSSIPASGATG